MLDKKQKIVNKQIFNFKGFLKLSISSIVLSSGLYAVDTIQPVDFTKYPLPKEKTAKSRGGDLPDKTAATDGVGAVVLGRVGSSTDKLKNDAYNRVIYNNLDKLDNNKTINTLIEEGEITIDTNTLNKINNIFQPKFFCPTGLTLEGDKCYTDNLCTVGEPDGNGKCIVNNLSFNNIQLKTNSDACAIDSSNKLYCWGHNDYGQVGDGTTDDVLSMKKIKEDTEFSKIFKGHWNNCALAVDGDTYCWGRNDYGQLGDGTTDNKLVPTKVLGNHKFVNLVLALYHTCGIDVNGDTYCWGSGGYGKIGNGDTSNKTEPTLISGGYKFTKLVNGDTFTCGIEKDTYDVYCWGYNARGELGVGDTSYRSEPTKVSGNLKFIDLETRNYRHICGIEKDTNKLYCWGYNYYGELGDGTTDNKLIPTEVSGGLVVSKVSVGIYHTCAIEASSKNVYCWGAGRFGKLGNGSEDDELVPELVVGDLKFNNLYTTYSNTCGIAEDGYTYCWGDNQSNGKVGVGTTNSYYSTPQKTNGDKIYKQFIVGNYHFCGIEKDTNKLYCWGDNRYGQLGMGDTDNRLEATLVPETVIDEGCTGEFTEEDGRCWIPALSN